MAVGRGLILVLGAAGAAFAADPCIEGRDVTGLAVGIRAGAVAVVDVALDSAAARAGFRAGDVVRQANDVVPSTCAQWARAVDRARGDDKALLVLVRRDQGELPLVLGAGTWAGPATARGPAAEPPSETGRPAPRTEPGAPAPSPERRPTAVPPAPPPLPADAPASVDGVLRGLAALAPLDRPPSSLIAYRESVTTVRREIETLAARGAAPEADLEQLRGVMRYYEGAALAWEALEGDRADDRLSRRLPQPESKTAPYFSDSPVAALLDEFSFLEGTVARRPYGVRFAESSGLWRPAWARLLLWERGAQALDEARGRLAPGA